MEEDQFILRLPPPLVERMRLALSSTRRRDAAGEDKKASAFKINFTDERNATFTVDDEEYPASLIDLPAICETHKTADKRTYYKSGDLHQILIVRMPGDPAPTSTVLQDGLTPAAREAGRRLAESPKTFPAPLASSIEQRIKYVIDHKIKFKQKKDKVEEHIVIEEETVAASDAKPSTNDQAVSTPADLAPTQPATPAASTPIDAAVLAPAIPSPMPEATTPMDIQPSPSPAPADTPLPADTPMPDAEDDDDDDDEDDDDDDFSDMAGELAGELVKDEEEETRKRIERTNLDIKIKEQKQKIAEVDASADKAPNAIMKKRILGKRKEFEDVLQALEQSRAALED